MMMLNRLLLVVAAVLVGAGIAQAQADVSVNSYQIDPVEMSAQNPCSETGESFTLYGSMKIRDMLVATPTGPFTGVHTEVLQFDGETESGVSYRYRGMWSIVFNGETAQHYSTNGEAQLVSQGAEPNMSVTYTVYVTVNPLGEVTANVSDWRLRCNY